MPALPLLAPKLALTGKVTLEKAGRRLLASSPEELSATLRKTFGTEYYGLMQSQLQGDTRLLERNHHAIKKILTKLKTNGSIFSDQVEQWIEKLEARRLKSEALVHQLPATLPKALDGLQILLEEYPAAFKDKAPQLHEWVSKIGSAVARHARNGAEPSAAETQALREQVLALVNAPKNPQLDWPERFLQDIGKQFKTLDDKTSR
jgi:hypothetical protein